MFDSCGRQISFQMQTGFQYYKHIAFHYDPPKDFKLPRTPIIQFKSHKMSPPIQQNHIQFEFHQLMNAIKRCGKQELELDRSSRSSPGTVKV